MRPRYELAGKTHTVAPVRQSVADRNNVTVAIDGTELPVQIERHGNHRAILTVNGKRFDCWVAQDNDKLFVHLNGRSYELQAITEFAAAAAGGSGSGQIKAPMPGVVLECHASAGDSVAEGQSLMMIESMKLQTEITAPASGTVTAMNVEAGQSFDKGTVLIEVAAEAEADA